MDNTELLQHYFPELDTTQQARLLRLEELYQYWNQRVNVVSRKDIGNLFVHHVLHSLSIARFASFPPVDRVIDAGTGGGFPGIPLAIAFPGTEFCLVDSTAKKLNVVDEICSELGIVNITTYHVRLEEFSIPHIAIVSRAVSALPVFMGWVRHLVRSGGSRHMGVYYLKGGDVEEEAAATGHSFAVHDLTRYFPLPYFETKKLVHLLP